MKALYMFPVLPNATGNGRFHVACGTSTIRRLDRRFSEANILANARAQFNALPNRHLYAGFIISTVTGRPDGTDLTEEDFYHG